MILAFRGTFDVVPVRSLHWRVVEICDEGDADHSDAAPFLVLRVCTPHSSHRKLAHFRSLAMILDSVTTKSAVP